MVKDLNEYFMVSVDLRVKPYSNLAMRYVNSLAINLVNADLINIVHKREHKPDGSDEDIFYQIQVKGFERDTTLREMFDFFEKEQKKLQEEFTYMLDQAYMIEKLTTKKEK